jgi:chromosome segregation ATPase
MMRCVVCVWVLCGVLWMNDAGARSNILRPPSKPSTTSPTVGCHFRKAVLQQEQERKEQASAQLAVLDAELTQLKKRTEELTRRKWDVQRDFEIASSRYVAADKDFQKQCSRDPQCDQYERMAGELATQSKPSSMALEDVRTQMVLAQGDVRDLNSKIEPLQRSYNAQGCGSLVAGQTEQSTIDACTLLFSEWNRLQIRLNQQNSQLAALKTRYEVLMAEVNSWDQRALSYQSYLNKHCKDNTQTAMLGEYRTTRERAQSLGRELDALIADVVRLRGVRITVALQ